MTGKKTALRRALAVIAPWALGLAAAVLAACLGWTLSTPPEPPVEPGSDLVDLSAAPEVPPEPEEDSPGALLDEPTEEDKNEFLATCRRIADKLGSVDLEDCTESDLQLSGARSVQGTPILVAEYPPLEGRKPLGRVLLFGGIHGDELSSVSIVYTWLDMLEQHHSGLFHWRVVPLLNPDGLLRRESQRMNERGVDLNRNFPSPNWEVEAPDYWVRRTSRNPRRYPGEAPLSEPESRWLHEQIETFQPGAIVAVHAPIHLVDYDGPPEPPEKLGPLDLRKMGTYPGSLGRYAGIHLGLPVVTIELPSAGIMPSRDDQRRMWIDLVAWLRENLPKQEPLRTARLKETAAGTAAGMER